MDSTKSVFQQDQGRAFEVVDAVLRGVSSAQRCAELLAERVKISEVLPSHRVRLGRLRSLSPHSAPSDQAVHTKRSLAQKLHSRIEAVGDDPADIRRAGVDVATELCQALLDAGAPGLHFYTLNRSTATRDIYARLGLDRAEAHIA